MIAYKIIGGTCVLAILGKQCSCSHHLAPAFVNNRYLKRSMSLGNDRELHMTKETDEAIFDAETAAAIDAYDLSDSGMEGAAMERAVMMAAGFEEQHEHNGKIEDKPEPTLLGKIRSLFHQTNNTEEANEAGLREVGDAEANYAHDLSDTAAMEHAKEVLLEDNNTKDESRRSALFKVMDGEDTYAHALSDTAAMEHANEVLLEDSNTKDASRRSALFKVIDAEASYAHDLSDTAAMEHANEVLLEDSNTKDASRRSALFKVIDAEASYAHGLSDAAAMEHILNEDEAKRDVVDSKETAYVHDLATYVHDLSKAAAIGALPNTHDDASIAAVEEHYNSIEKDITRIEHLIEEADRADRSEGHSLERTFSDDDAADLALMMMEKSITAATDKLELCQKKAEQTENEVKIALEEKYCAKALAESLERERRAAERRFLSTEHFSEDIEVMERRRDSAMMHADRELLADALNREHNAELQLEEAIEHDIATKKELEQTIDNKAALKQELHHLEDIIHERTHELWEKENANKKGKSEKENKVHHSDWWHKRW
eukprot:1014105_1